MIIVFSGICFSLAIANNYNYDVIQITDSKINQPWTFQATTNDPDIVQVTFHYWFPWDQPGNSEVSHQTITGSSPYIATIVPDKEGHWGVVVDFQSADGVTHRTITHDEEILEFGFPPNVVPEVPILGTLGVVFAMVAGFGYYVKRKNRGDR